MPKPSPSKSALAKLQSGMFGVLGRAPDMPVWRWIEENVTLTERETAEPGKFSTIKRPYVREPLECFRDKSVTDLILCWGTQTSKTMTIMCGAAYKIVNDAMNALWVMPNSDLCKSFSRNRWQPFVDNCRLLALQKPTDRHKWKTLEQFFSKTTLTFVGSNSPANLASRPAGMLLMDEVDKFELKGDKEAGALQNAEERTKTFPYPIRVKTSTPTTAAGEIWHEFLSGDQRYFFVPCPHCKIKIRLEWKQIRWWDEKEEESKGEDGEWDLRLVRKNTFYRCQECDGKILDGQKTAMLRDGEWRPMNPTAQPGRRSYHLNSLYAALKETQWGILAVKWLQTKGSISRRHAFINSTLAETWDDEKGLDDDPLNTTEYTDIDLPQERIPVMTVDCQENHFWVVVRAWGRGSESWLLHAGRVEVEEELENLARQFNVEPFRVALDMAHRPNVVARLCVKNGWRGLWGSPNKKGFVHTLGNGHRIIRDFSPTQSRDPHLGTVHQSEGNKRALFAYWAVDAIADRLAILRYSVPTKWHVHSRVDNDYIRQINAEVKMTRINPMTGKPTYYWKQLRRDNHLGDCERLQVVMALAGGILEDDSMKDANSQKAFGFMGAKVEEEAPENEEAAPHDEGRPAVKEYQIREDLRLR
ncbi:MAG: terminase gpA endonuclease subunit [Verrucomicrobiota bacterium]